MFLQTLLNPHCWVFSNTFQGASELRTRGIEEHVYIPQGPLTKEVKFPEEFKKKPCGISIIGLGF